MLSQDTFVDVKKTEEGFSKIFCIKVKDMADYMDGSHYILKDPRSKNIQCVHNP